MTVGRMQALWGTWAPSLPYLLSMIIYLKQQTKAPSLALWTTGLWLSFEVEFLTNKLFHAFVWGINSSGLRFSYPNLKNAAASWEAQRFPPLPELDVHFVFLEDSSDWQASPLAVSSAICFHRFWLKTSKSIKAAKHFKSHSPPHCVWEMKQTFHQVHKKRHLDCVFVCMVFHVRVTWEGSLSSQHRYEQLSFVQHLLWWQLGESPRRTD